MTDLTTVYDITTMPPGTQQLMLATETQPMGLRIPEYPADPDPYRVKGPCREEPDFNVLLADLAIRKPDRFEGFVESYPLTEADVIFYTGVAAMRRAEEDKRIVSGGILALSADDGGMDVTKPEPEDDEAEMDYDAETLTRGLDE